MLKQKRQIQGVAVYPKKIPPDGKVQVGVWVRRQISDSERAVLMGLNQTAGLGHIGIGSVRRKTTTVRYIGPATREETATSRTPRQIAIRLARAVRRALAVEVGIQQMSNNWLVARSLTGR